MDDFSPPEHSILRVGAPGDPPVEFKQIVVNEVDKSIFVAPQNLLWKPPFSGKVYGGQVVGQALAAAVKTVSYPKILVSAHCYFLVAGDNSSDIVYRVKKLRDGRSFATRLVQATQNERTIFALMASYQAPEPSELVHQLSMPANVPAPMDTMSAEEYYKFIALHHKQSSVEKQNLFYKTFMTRVRTEEMSKVETRFVALSDKFSARKGQYRVSLPDNFPKHFNSSKRMLWIRCRQKLPENDLDYHHAVLAYASDMFLLSTSITEDFSHRRFAMIASLDHSIWFHAPFRADEWLLYEMESWRANGSRGLSVGRIFREDGVLAVSCTQEGLLRMTSKPPTESKL